MMMMIRMTMTKTFCAEWLSGSVVVVELGSVIDQCHECEGPGGQHSSTPTLPPPPPLPLSKSELMIMKVPLYHWLGSTNTHDNVTKGQTH